MAVEEQVKSSRKKRFFLWTLVLLMLVGVVLAASPCSHCGGTGKCWTCGGTGETTAGTCTMCNGNKKCWYCGGSGEV